MYCSVEVSRFAPRVLKTAVACADKREWRYRLVRGMKLKLSMTASAFRRDSGIFWLHELKLKQTKKSRRRSIVSGV